MQMRMDDVTSNSVHEICNSFGLFAKQNDFREIDKVVKQNDIAKFISDRITDELLRGNHNFKYVAETLVIPKGKKMQKSDSKKWND